MEDPISSQNVDIVVVPRDRFSMFPRCLDALYAHTSTRFHVTVVAGDVDSKTREYFDLLLTQKDNLRVILADHLLTQGEARNIGLRQANKRFCVVLENDTIVHENWLPPLFHCMREEEAAAVTPLLFWYRGIHAAGCMFEEREIDGIKVLNHRILYTGFYRKRIDYPENHCILLDRQQLPDTDIFDDVEPFDVDLGLLCRKYGLKVFLEPDSAATYSAPPLLEVRDIRPFKLRWDAASWEKRNLQFRRKWGVYYDPASKLASYRRQQLKFGLAFRHPNKLTVWVSNVYVSLINLILSLVIRR